MYRNLRNSRSRHRHSGPSSSQEDIPPEDEEVEDIAMGDEDEEEVKRPIPMETESTTSEEVPITEWVRSSAQPQPQPQRRVYELRSRTSNLRREPDDASDVGRVNLEERQFGHWARFAQQHPTVSISSSASSSASPAPSGDSKLSATQLHAKAKERRERQEIELYGQKATSIVEVEKQLRDFSHERDWRELRRRWDTSISIMLSGVASNDAWRLEYGHVFDAVTAEVENANRHLLPQLHTEPEEEEEEEDTSNTKSRKRKGRMSSVAINHRARVVASPRGDGPLTLMLQADLCFLSLAELRTKYEALDLAMWGAHAAFGDDGPLPFDPDYTDKVKMLLNAEMGDLAYRPTDADLVHALAVCNLEAFRAILNTAFVDRANSRSRMTFFFRNMPIWKLFYSANHLPISRFRQSSEQQCTLAEIITWIDERSTLVQRAEVKEFEDRVSAEEETPVEQRRTHDLRFVAMLDDYAILLAYFCRADACLLIMSLLWSFLSQRQQILFLIYGPLYAGYNRKLTIKAKDRGLLTYDIREWGRWFKAEFTKSGSQFGADYTQCDHYIFLSTILPNEVLHDPSIWLNRAVLSPVVRHIVSSRGMSRKSASFKRHMGLVLNGRSAAVDKDAGIFSRKDFFATLGEESDDYKIANALRQISRGTLNSSGVRSSASSREPSKPKLRQQQPLMMLEKDVFENPLFGTLYFDPRRLDPRVRDQLQEYTGSVPVNPVKIVEYWKERFQSLASRVYVGVGRFSPSTLAAPVGFEYWCNTMRSSFSSLLYMLETQGREITINSQDDIWEQYGGHLVMPKIYKYYHNRKSELSSVIAPLPITIVKDMDDDLEDDSELTVVEADEKEYVAFSSVGRQRPLSAAALAELEREEQEAATAQFQAQQEEQRPYENGDETFNIDDDDVPMND